MSEEEKAPEEKPAQPAVQIDEKKIAEIARTAIGPELKAELAAMVKEQAPAGVSEEQIQQVVSSSLQNMFAGKKEEKKQVDPLLQNMVDNPTEFFKELVTVARDLAKEDVAKESKIERERRLAAAEVLEDRPDVTKNDHARRFITRLYQTTDEADSETDRWKAALKEYDALLEAQGAGNAESRISKAVGVAGGGKGSAPSPGRTPVDERESAREELLERRSRWNKAMSGGFFVPNQNE